MFLSAFANLCRLAALVVICYVAYNIRLHAVTTFGRVIHEFDPYFNFRATEYLVTNGWSKFINWFDERSWYPLGRPVGTTIYPGLQISSAVIHYVLNKILKIKFSINDVCVFTPAWFSTLTCLFTFLIGAEVSSPNAGVAAAAVMAVIPAHIMRSVAGGYDNESIAVFCMVMTFYFWILSLRNERMWPVGVAAALAYICMAAAWGGYVFVLNMIGVHAILLVFLGFYSSQLHRAYSLFYVIGTFGAIQVPVIGLAPLKSLEQLGPMLVFFILQLCCLMEWRRRSMPDEPLKQFRIFQLQLLAGVTVLLSVVVAILAPMGYFGPLSSRIRGLFVQHTHTGNPLVDSVAEHQATQDEAYATYFDAMCYLAPAAIPSLIFWRRSEAKYFLLSFAFIAMYFSRKMVRLILLLSPAASVLGGITIAGVYEWSFSQLWLIVEYAVPGITEALFGTPVEEELVTTEVELVEDIKEVKDGKSKDGKEKTKKEGQKSAASKGKTVVSVFGAWDRIRDWCVSTYERMQLVRLLVAIVAIIYLTPKLRSFWNHSEMLAVQMSNPSIILQGTGQNGQVMKLDDFRLAYWWLRDNTPADSRVFSWWDYGYQLASIANRTTLADGNTWNHEHIALLGKILVSSLPEAHKIVRHLADYVLVWSTRFVGNPSDDVAKSPHMARIGGSVFKDIRPDMFYIDSTGRPSKMMFESLVFNLVMNGFDQNVPRIGNEYFEEVYTSPYRMVRIYKIQRVDRESKAYCAENRGYQAWLDGQPLLTAYPPKLQGLLSKREDFEQLEDFNARKNKKKKATKKEL